jgi:hypothetical protein
MSDRGLGDVTTDQLSEILESAAFFHDLSDDTKKFLRDANKEKIDQLNSTIRFMDAAGIIGKFLWIGGATAFGLFVGVTQVWDWISKFFKVPLK